MEVEWLATLKVETPQGETTITTASTKPVQEKGKRNIVESTETEESYKFKEDPLVEIVDFEIDAKRRQHDRRIAQRKREKQRLEEAERKLQEVQQKLEEEQELCRREKEARYEPEHEHEQEDVQGAQTMQTTPIQV